MEMTKPILWKESSFWRKFWHKKVVPQKVTNESDEEEPKGSIFMGSSGIFIRNLLDYDCITATNRSCDNADINYSRVWGIKWTATMSILMCIMM